VKILLIISISYIIILNFDNFLLLNIQKNYNNKLLMIYNENICNNKYQVIFYPINKLNILYYYYIYIYVFFFFFFFFFFC